MNRLAPAVVLTLALTLSVPSIAQAPNGDPSTLSIHVQQLSEWKSIVESDASSINSLYFSDQTSLQITTSQWIEAKLMYDAIRASINAVIDRLIVDMQQKTLPPTIDPYRPSIHLIDKSVSDFRKYVRSVILQQIGFKDTVLSAIGTSLESLVTCVLEGSCWSDDDMTMVIERLTNLQLRDFMELRYYNMDIAKAAGGLFFDPQQREVTTVWNPFTRAYQQTPSQQAVSNAEQALQQGDIEAARQALQKAQEAIQSQELFIPQWQMYLPPQGPPYYYGYAPGLNLPYQLDPRQRG